MPLTPTQALDPHHIQAMTDPRRVGAICFDLDDTLFSFSQYVRAGLSAAADHVERRTGRALHDELHSLYFEEGVTEGTFDALIARHDLDEDLIPELVDAYHDHRESLAPYPETMAVLSRLGSRYDLGVLTDGRNGNEKLARLGLADYFDAVVVVHGRDVAKPDAEAFELIVDRLGVDPTATVYVGDHPMLDVHGANQLGMTTVRVRRGRFADEPHHPDAEPDLEVSDLSGLLDWLGIGA